MLVAPLSGQLFGQSYDYQIVARTGQVIGGKTLFRPYQASLNNAGQVAYTATFGPASSDGGGIFIGPTMIASTGQTVAGRTITSFGGQPWINNAGQVAYVARYTGGSGIFVDSGLVVASGQVIGGRTVNGFSSPFLDDAGQVVFTGNSTTIFTPSSVLAAGFSARRNSLGQVVYVTSDERRFATIGLGGATVGPGSFLDSKTVQSIFSTRGSPSINNSGQIAFCAAFSEGAASNIGIFRMTFGGDPVSPTAVELLVKGGQSVGNLTLGTNTAFNLSMNNRGTLVFESPIAPFPDGGSGIFTQNGLVIRTGTVIGGKTVSSFGLGLPAINDSGQIAFEASFTDGTYGVVLATLGGPSSSLQISTSALPAANSGQVYSTTLAASGGSGTGYAWSIASGTLPSGFTLSPAGVLASSGTPAAVAGTYPITFRVTDSAGNTATKALPLSVQPGIQVTTTTLPSGVTGSFYEAARLSATGGSGNYLWSLSSGTLPAGYDFLPTGAILASAGNAASPGRYPLRFKATDIANSSASGERDLVLNILGTVTILDPVPQLLDGPKVTGDRARLISKGRPVKGIAADGIAQIVFRIPTIAPGDQVTATLLSDQCGDPSNPNTCAPSGSSDENGGLLPVGLRAYAKTSLPSTVTDVSTSQAMAFMVYRAPLDFSRSAISPEASRATKEVQLKLTYSSAGQVFGTQIISITVVRPPLAFVHGFNTFDRAAWETFNPLIRDTERFSIFRVNYGRQLFKPVIYACGTTPPKDVDDFCIRYEPTTALNLTSTIPAFPLDILHRKAMQSHLGFSYNAPLVGPVIQSAILNFKSGTNAAGIPVAAVSADVVAHSMGGLVVRYLTALPNYRNPLTNYDEGYIHKLVTLGTPHWGTPQATLSLLTESDCTRQGAAFWAGSLSFSSGDGTVNGVAVGKDGIPGAAGELSGDGIGVALNSKLGEIAKKGVPIPIATLAGDVTSIVAGLASSTRARLIRGRCSFKGDPIAIRFTPQLYATMFDPQISATNANGKGVARASDGSVPLTSALMDAKAFQCGDSCFNGYSHSDGIAPFFEIPFGSVVNHLQDSSQTVPNRVLLILNSPISDRRIWK